MHDDCYDGAFVARRHGVAVGAAFTREGALSEAGRHGISRADVAPAPVDVAARTARALRTRTWTGELELLRAIHRSAVLAYTGRDEDETWADAPELDATPGDDLLGAGWPGIDDDDDEATAEALLARIEVDIDALEADAATGVLPLGAAGCAS